MKHASLLALLLVGGCKFSPLMNRITVGEEPFAVVVGEGPDGRTDLFAVSAGGGLVTQLTFTVPIEVGPRLTTNGGVLAFVRMRDTLPTTPHEVVVMNLVSGGERALPLPTEAGQPQQVAWSDDETTLYVRTDRGMWAIAAPPAAPTARAIPAGDAVADTALTLWLGTPRFARGISCGAGVCVITPRGDTTQLTPTGHHPLRWGTDSVAWFDGDALMIRSLGPGGPRRMTWSRPPQHPRDAAYAKGIKPTPTP